MLESMYDLSIKVRNETASKEEMIDFITRSIAIMPSIEMCTIEDIKKLAYFVIYANNAIE